MNGRTANNNIDKKISEEQFEEISLDSRKRKYTTASAKERKEIEAANRKPPYIIAGMEIRKYFCIVILFFINLLNYMDRYTVAGVLTDVKHFYTISDKVAGFLQTIFIIFFMLFAPICGFFGDRFNRKRIIIAGEIIWVGAVLASSFIPENHFWAFVLLRGVVGIGEASYAVIAPTMIADMFVGKMRSRVLMFFYFAIPVGSGLGYVVGSMVTSIAKGDNSKCADCWQWGVRSTPAIGLITLIALIVGVEEPVRGEAENQELIQSADETTTANRLGNTQSSYSMANNDQQQTSIVINHRRTPEDQEVSSNSVHVQMRRHLRSYASDLHYLAKNKTFVWATIGYTAVVFVTGTLAWWGPASIEEAMAWHGGFNSTEYLKDKDGVSLAFGIITCTAGIVGVSIGSIISLVWKQGKWCFADHATPKADPLICSIGSFAATPLLFLALLMVQYKGYMALTWFLLFVTIVCLSLNWSVIVDMLMSIIVPNRRSIASAVQILISHTFGDASGPWIVGAISDWVRHDETPEARFHALLIAFYLPNALLLISGITFLVASFTLPTSLRQFEEHSRASRITRSEASRFGEQTATIHSPQQQLPQISTNNNANNSALLQGVQNDAFE